MQLDYAQDPLWHRLSRMELDDPTAPVGISERIALETGLNPRVIKLAVEEYKKFVYVAVSRGIPPAMPALAERIWTTHITYTRHYREVMCDQVLHREFHYVSRLELQSLSPETDPLERALEAYRQIFGARPPPGLATAFPFATYAKLKAVAKLLASVLVIGGAFYVSSQWALALLIGTLFVIQAGSVVLGKISSMRKPAQQKRRQSFKTDRVWLAIADMQLETLGGPNEPFLVQLKTATDWDAERCALAVGEYRRFLYIRHIADHQVTPSSTVDQVWHLHLRHSKHYWDELCHGILRKPFHHNPACGRPGEWARFREQYHQTLATYKTVFGSGPPEAFWPVKASPAQQQGLLAGWGAFAVLSMIVMNVPEVPKLAGTVLAAVVSILAGVAGFLFPVTDEAQTRREFRYKPKGWLEVSTGGCGGCGGCGG